MEESPGHNASEATHSTRDGHTDITRWSGTQTGKHDTQGPVREEVISNKNHPEQLHYNGDYHVVAANHTYDMNKNTLYVLLTLAVAIMLLLCLADMPYGYYELVRYVSAVFFAYLAYKAFRSGQDTPLFVFGALALLFQPFMKIALGRTVWNIIDVVVAVGLLYVVYVAYKNKIHNS